MPQDSVICHSDTARRQAPGYPEVPGLVLEQKICDGGMGSVFAAHDVELDTRVAVKVLQDDLPEDCQWEYSLRFEREIRIHADLPEHPNLVKCLRAGRTASGVPHLVMELVTGGDLCDFIADDGPMSIVDAVHVTNGVLAGLEHLHSNGRVVHRDIKPENILLEPIGHPTTSLEGRFTAKLADLGLAKGTQSQEITWQGTPPPLSVRAAAPEIFTTPGETDFRADVYGAGCVLYYALTGSSPHDEPNPDMVVFKKLNYEAPAITDIAPHVPADVAEIVQRSLKRDPMQRYGSYMEMSAALEAVIGRLQREDAAIAARNAGGQQTAQPADDLLQIISRRRAKAPRPSFLSP